MTPHNLRYSPLTGTVKLAGFELAREVGSVGSTSACLTHEVVTLWYRAPEVLLGATHYDGSIDGWAMGAVLAELATGQPLLPGDSEIGQLVRTFRLLGTPDEACWPGVSALPNFLPTFPQLKLGDARANLEQRAPQLIGRAAGAISDASSGAISGASSGPPGETGVGATDGVHLVSRLMEYSPERRLSMADALRHPFFDDVDKVNVGTVPLEGMGSEVAEAQ